MKRRKTYRKRIKYPKDIGLRHCITCRKNTRFVFFQSRNTWICEECEYQEAMGNRHSLLDSESRFLDLLNKKG